MSKWAIFILLMGFFIVPCYTNAQKSMSTDRPGATDNTAVLPLGQLQFELGFLKDSGVSGSNGVDLSKYGGTIRYGMFQNAEFRVTGFQNSTNDQSGFGSFSLGSKIALVQESKHLPNISLLADVTLASIGSDAFSPNKSTPSLLFLLSKTMNDIWSFYGNLGYAWNDLGNSTFIYSLSSRVAITEEIGAFIEIFGTNPSIGNAENYLDFGASIWLLEDVQLDVSYGLGLNDFSTNSFFGFGVSMRIF